MLFSKLIDIADDYIMHEGRGHDDNPPGRGSGVLPWGSGKNPFQHSMDILDRFANLKAKYPNASRSELAERLNMYNRNGEPSTDVMDRKLSHARAIRDQIRYSQALEMKEQGLSNVEIGRRLGVADNTVGKWLKKGEESKRFQAANTAKMLKNFVDENKYVDISKGTHLAYGVTKGKLDTAVEMLKKEGYSVHKLKLTRFGSGTQTEYECMIPPGYTFQDLREHQYDVKNPLVANRVISPEGEVSKLGIKGGKPVSIDVSRIKVEYDSPSDGLIELRRGVPDISLGNKSYAQIRMAVDDSHYIKGMAVNSDNMPPGIDIIVHSNKKEGTPLLVKDDPDAKQVLKPMKTVVGKDGKLTVDWDNPFGASVSQKSEIMDTVHQYYDKDGSVRESSLHVLREEGDWAKFDRNLSSQYWSKQSVATADRQLNLAVAAKKLELEGIHTCENPTVRKNLLIKFADECDSAAVDLHAAPFKGQMTHVLLPCPALGDNEVYAPNYPDGTKVALVRYPFAGKFESPLLTVRNTGSPAQSVIPLTAKDAVCVNKHRLDQMSGADCDGDFVSVIPVTDTVKVNTAHDTLDGLKGFDTKTSFPKYDGMKPMSHQTHGLQMGMVTNLITDMSFQSPSENEVVRAVKHSMVVVDAEKHELNWKASELASDIRGLKLKYQADSEGHTGAGTIISRSRSPVDVDERKIWRPSKTSIDEEGNKIYKHTDKTTTSAKLDLNDVPLTNGSHVKLTYDKSEKSFYYLSGDKDPNTNKKIRKYVSDEDLPERLRGLRLSSEGRVFLNKDKDGKDYYLRYDENYKPIRTYVKPIDVLNTKTEKVQQKSTRMAEATDPYKLTSGGSKEYPGHEMERVAAKFATEMKELAKSARREWLRTEDQVYSPEAAKKYAKEVASINKKLADALSSAPLERQAQRMAHETMRIKKYEDPDMTNERRKKLEGQAIVSARLRLNSRKPLIEINADEAEAIKAGAIKKTHLEKILENSDVTSVRMQFTPKATKHLSAANKAQIKNLVNAGALEPEQIARMFNISASYVKEIAGE